MKRVEIARTVAEALVEIKAADINVNYPYHFKSSMLSPVYVDNRKLPFHPKEWRIVIEAFSDLIHELHLPHDVLAGVEAAGIPHTAALGFSLETPSVFVRKQPKDHGLKKRVEGGDVTHKRVLLIEDHVTTALSSLDCVDAIRKEGGIVESCLAITTYALPEADAAFVAAGVVLYTLTEFLYILDVLMEKQKLNTEDRAVVDAWFQDPHGWTNKLKR